MYYRDLYFVADPAVCTAGDGAASVISAAPCTTHRMRSCVGLLVSLLVRPAQLLADPGRMVQVLVNLRDTAATYSPVGSPIVVSCDCKHGLGVVRVRDLGPGVPDHGRKRLFTRCSGRRLVRVRSAPSARWRAETSPALTIAWMYLPSPAEQGRVAGGSLVVSPLQATCRLERRTGPPTRASCNWHQSTWMNPTTATPRCVRTRA